jgi:hypothetical protein
MSSRRNAVIPANDSLDVELIRVNKESHHRLFVVGIASRIGFDVQSRPRIPSDDLTRGKMWHKQTIQR